MFTVALYTLTLWFQILYAQNAKYYVTVSVVLQPLFKFWFAADHARHFNSGAKG
jgi:hypothetical protein